MYIQNSFLVTVVLFMHHDFINSALVYSLYLKKVFKVLELRTCLLVVVKIYLRVLVV